jgi:hypothetical protein
MCEGEAMIRDPFYRQIIDRLKGPLDPELFEQCAADLLRAIYPTLVPMRGGADSGMDGAIADGEGEPFSLVTTTDERVLRNLTRSLKKNWASCWSTCMTGMQWPIFCTVPPNGA